MVVDGVILTNFRNISEASVGFSEGVNVLVGDNGQGKTNLLESIYMCSIGKSFRGAGENEMIGFGCRHSMVELQYKDSLRPQEIAVMMTRTSRRVIEHNKVRVRRMSEMVGNLSCVLFCPEHLSMVKDGPAERRNYLDIALSQLRPAYISSLQRYNKVLKQRNALIKNAERDPETFRSTIEFWSAQLAYEAARISRMRVDYVKRARVLVADFFKDMTGGNESAELIYAGSSHDEEAMYEDITATEERYLKLLTENLPREVAAGSTLWGTHKDDINILLNSHPARAFASQGQQRSIALAMKLSEGDINRDKRGESPVMLLDDVFSELDSRRRDYLLKNIVQRQVIITSCDEVPVGDARIIHVKEGRYY